MMAWQAQKVIFGDTPKGSIAGAPSPKPLCSPYECSLYEHKGLAELLPESATDDRTACPPFKTGLALRSAISSV